MNERSTRRCKAMLLSEVVTAGTDEARTSPRGLVDAVEARAAVSAGMRAIGYVADSDETALRAAGAEVLRSMRELLRLLALG